ncbi:tudor domain-containing protein 1-like isoform X2 [Halichondria panicea]|uniref:tudor domain-containing protein 1-like isoform X2 n=1 Tax=Halichondria panicea TaxID=6063 RepID=UPI00312B9CC1
MAQILPGTGMCLNCGAMFNLTDHVPLKLTCGCNLCEACVTQKTRHRKESVACPKCGVTTTMHSHLKPREQLPANLFVLGGLTAERMGLISVPRDIRARMDTLKQFLSDSACLTNIDDEDASPKIFCEECSQTANVKCDKCGGVYCHSCFAVVHSSSRSMRTHVSTPISLVVTTPSPCSTHPGNIHTHYCETDKTLICPDCLLEKHRDHSIKRLHDLASDYRERLAPLLESASDTLAKMFETEKTLADKLKSLSSLLESSAESVPACFALLHNALETQGSSVLRELIKAVSLYGRPLQTAKRVVHSHVMSLNSAVRETKAALDSDNHIIENGENILLKLSNIHHLPQGLDVDNHQPIKFSVSPIKCALKSGCLTFDPEYKGPALLCRDGPVDRKYLDVTDERDSIPGSSVTEHLEIPGQRSEVRHSATLSSSISPVSDRTDSSIQHKKVAVDIQGAEHLEIPGQRSEVRRSATPSSPVSDTTDSSTQHKKVAVDIQGADDVLVTHMESLDEFYVQTQQQQAQVAEIMAQLHVEDHSVLLSADDLYIGLPCAAIFSQDGKWYRASVTRCLGNHSVTVKYVDYGNSEDVGLLSMLQLPCHLLLVPPLCSRCALANISPFKEGSYRHSSWTREAVSVFSNFASMDSVKMKIHNWTLNGVLLVDLLYQSNVGHVSLCATLVTMGLAVRGLWKLPKLSEDGITPHCTLGCGDTREVEIPVAENPYDFFVHIKAQLSDLEELIEQTRRSAARNKLPIGSPRKGMLCIAQYTADQMWYRGIVVDASEQGIRVLFLDFGNDDIVSTVYPLHHELRRTQVQAIHCSLHNVKPLKSEDTWPENVADFFNEHIGGKLWTMVVKDVIGKGVASCNFVDHPLDVEMIEINSGVNLSTLLVNQGMARYEVVPVNTVCDIVADLLSSVSNPNSDHDTRSPSAASLSSTQPAICLFPQPSTTSSKHGPSSSPPIRPSPRQKHSSLPHVEANPSLQPSQPLYSLAHKQPPGKRLLVGKPRSQSAQPWNRPSRKKHPSNGTPPPDIATRSVSLPPSQLLTIDSSSKSQKGTGMSPRSSIRRSEKPMCISPSQLPAKGSSLPCSVTYVSTTQYLNIVFHDDEYAQLLKQLSSSTSNTKINDSPLSLHCGDACLAQFPNDTKWYRAVVVEKCSSSHVKICYVDYGDTHKIMTSKLLSIPQSMCKIPAKAVKCVLKGIEAQILANKLPLFYQLLSSSGLTADVHERLML